MAKLKTNKAAKKRYSLTATGKIKRTKSNRRHLLAKIKQKKKKNLERFKTHMQVKHVKTQLKNYYHMVVNKK